VDLCLKHHPEYAVMADEGAAERLRVRRTERCPVLAGAEGLDAVASLPGVDVVVAATWARPGSSPRLRQRAGKRVLLANKEALVITGRLFMDEVRSTAPGCCRWTVSTMRSSSASPLNSRRPVHAAR
jgi:1-deoxy-D-xylulose-5-phosphate reductoisomerase